MREDALGLTGDRGERLITNARSATILPISWLKEAASVRCKLTFKFSGTSRTATSAPGPGSLFTDTAALWF
ncbi:unnamed protein product [Knipowitschia caucasica]|uniref:Uncharacterized protein n=1 Tax=Knipowitschia caucasica TaxID=637954 RepID=A0AAV2MPQ3_KNICA